MYLINIFPNTELSLVDDMAQELMLTNEVSKAYGLALTPQESREIVLARNNVLKDYDRVEVDTEIMQKIILQFCPSPHLQQNEYMDTIIELLELFHYLKNELNDEIGDDALIEKLADLYNKCCGDLELLKGRETEHIINQYKFGDAYDQETDLDDYNDMESWEDVYEGYNDNK